MIRKRNSDVLSSLSVLVVETETHTHTRQTSWHDMMALPVFPNASLQAYSTIEASLEVVLEPLP